MNHPSTAILSSTYFGPVQWYQKLYQYDRCLIEQHDHFIKQTYRNRCVIATTNGLQALTVPTERYDGLKCEMKDIRISDHGNWRHLHWNALLSAYGESPFFEFYADDLRPFFERRWDYLFDFNLAITHKMCELLDIEPDIQLTERYQPLPPAPSPSGRGESPIELLLGDATPLPGGEGQGVRLFDFRDAIRPKHPLPDPDFQPRPYYQVYQERFGFQPNLSILDLLFNEGNEAIFYLS